MVMNNAKQRSELALHESAPSPRFDYEHHTQGMPRLYPNFSPSKQVESIHNSTVGSFAN